MKDKYYGGSTYVKNLVHRLAQIDRENEYVLYVSPVNYPALKDLGENFRYEFAPNPRPLRVAWEQSYLPWDLKRKNVDVFHGPAFVTPLWKTCRYVVTVFDLAYFLTPETDTLIKRLYFRRLIPRVANKADAVLAISENTKRDICSVLGLPASKITVTYLAADERFYPRRDPLELNRVRARYGLQDKFLLFVGLIEPRKNLERLVKAFARIQRDHPDVKLVIGGELGWGYENLFEIIRRGRLEGHVLFTGRIAEEDLAAVYSLAEVFVYPSLLGGFGLPVLEALACGTPVVTSNSSSFPEIAGDAGLLVGPTSVDELAHAISRVLTDGELRRRMMERGLEHSRLFSWEKMARETLEVYQRVAR